MSEETENQTRSRERAIWPEEPEPFEDHYWQELLNESLDPAPTALIETESPISDPEPRSEVFDDQPPLAEVNADDDVWLNGPPPKDFPFFDKPQPPKVSNEEPWHDPLRPFEPPFVPVAYTPESTADTVRKTGLAWSAGIVFFGSVAFMLFLGWLADLVLGSSPWGLVGGVVLGSLIGFIQFFRISAQIYAPKPIEHKPLLTRDDESA